MIQFEKVWEKYFVFSDLDTGKFWPFDALWVKWLFEWANFEYDISSLKSWKHAVWIWKWNIYLLEEQGSKMKYLTK